MSRRLIALLALAALSGCAPSAVGTLDLRTEPAPIQGRRLLVVVAPPGLAGVSLPDTVRAAAFVPLDSLGAASYRGIAADTLVAALRASGAWTSVRVGTLPAGVALTSGPFRVLKSIRGLRDPRVHRERLTAPTAAPGAFGPDVDAVLVVSDAGTGFVKGRGTLASTNPVTGMVTPGVYQDDSIVTRATLVLWDDDAGAVAAYGVPAGAAPIRGRLFSSAESRSAGALARKSREAFVERVAGEVPALGLRE